MKEHAHLAYAFTAYGVQGVTVSDSHTVMDEVISAAGLYVGLTRGRETNTLHFIAENDAEAREQFVEAMTRDRADRGLDHASTQAREATRGLITDGPITFVNAERQRLTEAIAHAETQRAKWEQAATAVSELRQAHATEREQHKTVAAAAVDHAREVREETVTPLLSEAMNDGQAVLTAQQQVWDAGRAYQQTSRVRRRSVARARDDASRTHEHLHTQVRERWGTVPNSPEGLEAWAHTVAQKNADEHPAVIDAEHEAQKAQAASGQIATRQLTEQQQLRARIYGKTGRAPEGGPAAHAERWHNRAQTMRRNLNQIDTLSAVEAAELIRQQHAEAEARRVEAERARARRAEQVTIAEHARPSWTDPHRERGIGF